VENKPGILPVEFKVLILPEEVEETDPVLKRAKAAGIQLPDIEKEREQMAQMYGKLVAIGGNAFDDWKNRRPIVGDRVVFAKYAGAPVTGANGVKYRIAQDKDIAAVIE
jgi:co-chaperonin GroES (HSP10)